MDIDPSAVEIAKLRLWLSLVVDEESYDLIRPLPNLDYRIVCGNSLLSVDVKDKFFYWKKFQTLEQKKIQYFGVTSRRNKKVLREEIDGLIYQLTDGRQIFDFEVYFSEVYSSKKGFDIVIGNPPYIGEKGNKALFDKVKSCALKKYYIGKMDYFFFFFHLGIIQSNSKGILAFITTNYYLTANSAKKLRTHIKNSCNVEKLINFNEYKIFESAIGQHNIITVLVKGVNPEARATTAVTHRLGNATSSVLHSILLGLDENTKYFQIQNSNLYDGPNNYIRMAGTGQSIEGNSTSNILFKVKEKNPTLGEICHVDAGIHPGVDRISKKILKEYPDHGFCLSEGVFILSELEGKKFFGKTYLKPLYKNSDIKRWQILKNKYYILYSSPHTPIEDPEFISHISKYKKVLRNVRIRNRENVDSWKFLRRGVLNQRIYSNIPKIVTPYRSPETRFAWNETDFYASQDVYFITQKKKEFNLKYILAIINSKLYYFWLYHRGKRKGEMLELYKTPLSEIPIKELLNEEQQPFIELAEKILSLTHSSEYLKDELKQKLVQELEAKIDQLVFKLYNLTEEEIAIVEETIGR